MAICPKCSSEKCVKDGIVTGKQRYRCKSCDFRHTVQHRGKSPDVKRQALELYLEGLGNCSILPIHLLAGESVMLKRN